MEPRGRNYSWLDIGVRMAADAAMVNAALALLARGIVGIAPEKACEKTELMPTGHFQLT